MFFDPPEAAPVCSGQCTITKLPSDTDIGQSPCDTSSPSDTPCISYEAVLFYSVTITGETFHCAKRFPVVWEVGPAEGLFDKETTPPPPDIHNLTAPPSEPGDPIEAGVFNSSNQAEYIALVSNQGLEVDDDMEPAPENVPLVKTLADDTMFEG